MDFPVCPACGQSVIDDDAEDCPFCGASMKAKPGAKPAAQKSSAAAGGKPGTAAKPVATQAKSGGGGKQAPGKSDGDDFPFDTEIPGAKTAVQAMPGLSKGRSLKVVCPMCETAGYVPPTSAGKEVKCANPKCMVPIFKAPVPVAEAPPPPPPRKSNVMLIGIITTVVMVVGGGIAYVVTSQPVAATKIKTQMTDEEKRMLMEDVKSPQVGNPAENEKKNRLFRHVSSRKVHRRRRSPRGLRGNDQGKPLKQLNDACLIGERSNRSKPYCRQLAAEACALAGETAAAEGHLAQLIVVGPSVPLVPYRTESGNLLASPAGGRKGRCRKGPQCRRRRRKKAAKNRPTSVRSRQPSGWRAGCFRTDSRWLEAVGRTSIG